MSSTSYIEHRTNELLNKSDVLYLNYSFAHHNPTLSLHAAFAENVRFTVNEGKGTDQVKWRYNYVLLPKRFKNTKAGNNMVLLVTARALPIRIGCMG
jgi:hypothetical protein